MNERDGAILLIRVAWWDIENVIFTVPRRSTGFSVDTSVFTTDSVCRDAGDATLIGEETGSVYRAPRWSHI